MQVVAALAPQLANPAVLPASCCGLHWVALLIHLLWLCCGHLQGSRETPPESADLQTQPQKGDKLGVPPFVQILGETLDPPKPACVSHFLGVFPEGAGLRQVVPE
eukprot:10899753-Lingulodinium_polyedra.AAC.1